MSSHRFFLLRYPSILLISLLVALIAGGIMLWLVSTWYITVAYLHVRPPKESVFSDPQDRLDPQEFKRFKQRQLTLLKSQFVLEPSLQRKKIRELNSVAGEPHAMEWLSEELQVSYPDEGDILMVSFEGAQDPEEMKKIIDSVVDSYKSEVLAADLISNSERQRQLEATHKQLQSELRKKLDHYVLLKAELKTHDTALVQGTDSLISDLRKIALELPEDQTKARVSLANLIEELVNQPKQELQAATTNAELILLESEIEQLKELEQDMSLLLRKKKIETDLNGERVRCVQRAFSTDTVLSTEHYKKAGLVSLVTFCFAFLLLAFVGWVSKKAASNP